MYKESVGLSVPVHLGLFVRHIRAIFERVSFVAVVSCRCLARDWIAQVMCNDDLIGFDTNIVPQCKCKLEELSILYI